jgi:hypothetical protein
MTENTILFAFRGDRDRINRYKRKVERTEHQCPYDIHEVTGKLKEKLLEPFGIEPSYVHLYEAKTYFRQMDVLESLVQFFGDDLMMFAMGLLDSDLRDSFPSLLLRNKQNHRTNIEG